MRAAPVLPTMILGIVFLCNPAPASAASGFSAARAARFVAEFEKAVDGVNRKHLASPGKATEADLAKAVPRSFGKGLDGLLAMEDGTKKWDALLTYARIAAEVDMVDAIARVEKALRKGSPASADKLGHYVSRPRFLLHAMRVSDEFAEEFARVFEGVLKAYDRSFGFVEFSKVPGKKIRVELHKEVSPRPPHFAPQFPYHSTIDFPVATDDALISPTREGKFLFYGLCHELGHLIAMWGHRRLEEDHHAWAHYTGIVVVEACAKAPWAKRFRDRRARSVEAESKKQEATAPSRDSRAGVVKILLELHRLVGPKRIGKALNLMDEKRMGHRINQVRYYALADLSRALVAGSKSRKEKARIKRLLD